MLLHSDAGPGELVMRHARESAKQASGALTQLANTRAASAGLAEEHAQRREHAGRAREDAP